MQNNTTTTTTTTTTTIHEQCRSRPLRCYLSTLSRLANEYCIFTIWLLISATQRFFSSLLEALITVLVHFFLMCTSSMTFLFSDTTLANNVPSQSVSVSE